MHIQPSVSMEIRLEWCMLAIALKKHLESGVNYRKSLANESFSGLNSTVGKAALGNPRSLQ